MFLFHGGKQIVHEPRVIDNPRNDFGKGFYLCYDFDKAAEWACTKDIGPYGAVTQYTFDGFDRFAVLDFLDGTHNVFEWIATMLLYRDLNLPDEFVNSAIFLIDNFAIDTSNYDIVIGYRADDGYFSIVSNFLSGNFDIAGLKYAMESGLLGEQVVMKSQAAHDALYNPIGTQITDNKIAMSYFCAGSQRMQDASKEVNAINSHRGFHFYDLINAYEDLSVATTPEQQIELEERINSIIEEGRLGRK